ncbi:cleavage and polyadenylation specificity factor subunit 7 [Pleurodeles waltl]|uniref:cleavage and polyadenylation specificity factor subunit 7 n=1 Tax=Pleurodeles waltl TaxID=8319 RepID=UPI0037095823
MADGLDLIDIYAEEEFIQDSEFAAEQVDLYDDVLAATVAPPEEQQQQGSRRVSQSPGTTSSSTAAMGDSSVPKSNHQSMGSSFSNFSNFSNYAARKGRASVYVGNFAWWTTDQQLETIIRSVGVRDLIELKFAENRSNGQSKGYAEIVVASESSASQLIANLSSRNVHGDPLDVRMANKQNLSFFESMSRKRIPPRAKDSLDGITPTTDQTAATPKVENPPNVMQYFNRPPFMDASRVPVPHSVMNLPIPMPPGGPPPMNAGFRGPMPPPGLQYQQMMTPPPRLPPHMTGPPPGAVPPALHLNPAFFPPPNTALAPPPNPYDNAPPNPFNNRPPNPFNNRPPNPYNNRPPNPYDKAPPNLYNKGPPNPYTKGPPSPYGKTMNNPYMQGSKEMGGQGPGMSEEEFEEIMNRNRAISSSAISKAVAGASSGQYSTAAKTLHTAIAVIKESRVANDARCRVLLSSLKDCLRGIEAKSGTSSRKRHRSRERSSSRSRESSGRRHREGVHTDDRPEDYYERHRERDRHR